MTRGFELGHEGHGNLLGRGIYIAPTLAAAALWGTSDFIISCTLQPGTRILWVNGQYDQRIIDRLRREFGRELLTLGPHFARAIPANKQLTHDELIHLCTYVMVRMRQGRYKYSLQPRKGKREAYYTRWRRVSQLHEYIKRYGYDALGDRSHSHWDSDEIVVFNPARVLPRSAHHLLREGDDWDERLSLSDPVPLTRLEDLATSAQAEEE